MKGCLEVWAFVLPSIIHTVTTSRLIYSGTGRFTKFRFMQYLSNSRLQGENLDINFFCKILIKFEINFENFETILKIEAYYV